MTDKIPRIAILDYGMGNVGSIQNMLRHIGAEADLATNPEHLELASGIILPGVGHFDRAMENLARSGLAAALKHVAIDCGVPVLGICLGMQLMCKSSEEGSLPGLGFVNAHVHKFQFSAESGLKTPHMGWNQVKIQRSGSVLGDPNDSPAKFYFVHSFYVTCTDRQDSIGVTNYGNDFVSAFQHANITGVQFHPEKSHKFGMRLFKNFINSLV